MQSKGLMCTRRSLRTLTSLGILIYKVGIHVLLLFCIIIYWLYYSFCLCRWPWGLKRLSEAARLLGLRFLDQLKTRVLSLRRVEVFVTGRSLVRRSPTDCLASQFDQETSTRRRPWSNRGCRDIGEKIEFEFCKGTNYNFYFYYVWSVFCRA
jgi:hypothetical protein